jgi:hypothetical protein
MLRIGATRQRSTLAIALAGVSLFGLVVSQVAGVAGAVPPPPPNPNTGFTQPFSGTPKYEHLAPTQLTIPGQLHQPIGQRVADELAAQLGLSKKDVFTQKQYVEFVTGKGNAPDPASAKLADASVRIFTNTVGRPLYSNVNGQLTPSVLASYGLFVNTSGVLMSLANLAAPTRAANSIIEKGGYLDTFCKANGALRSLAALYRSAFTAEAVLGNASQTQSDPAQLVTNKKGSVSTEVGMSMAPSIWFVNFLLLYLLNPAVAAAMPAKWAPIPSSVADAILASPNGQVPYSTYESYLH